MTRTVKSTEAQQSFGTMLDLAPGEDDVIVERYGTSGVSIVSYYRFTDTKGLWMPNGIWCRCRLLQAAAAASARAAELSDEEINRLIEEARAEAQEARST